MTEAETASLAIQSLCRDFIGEFPDCSARNLIVFLIVNFEDAMASVQTMVEFRRSERHQLTGVRTHTVVDRVLLRKVG